MRPAPALLALLALAAIAPAQAPANYYNTVDTTSAASLRSTLHAVIDDHTRFPYTSSSSTDTWDILKDADEDPNNSSRILDVYRNASYAKANGGNSNYNREHVWPNSYGFPTNGGTNYPYTDCHHLFLCDIGYNGARDRRAFDIGNGSWNEFATVSNGGQGGGSGSYPGNSNWQTTSNSPGGWQVWHDRKGDIARAMFYMDIRYEGGNNGSGTAEPDLRLTDNLTLISQSATGNNLFTAYMGKLSVLVQWHQQDPVDAKEMARNNAVFGYQGNRNPFIDNPTWADCIYSNQCGTTSSARAPEIWINELHYDNSGVDVGEFVELAGRAGENVHNWMLIAYDGTTGNAYSRVHLRGTFANQQNNFGVLSFDFPDLQNSTDGVCLVTSSGVVMQFLSYEGTLLANNGAAKGLTSTDIGVSESSSTPIGFSLRLAGTGSSYGDFTWQPASASSSGAINANQQFQ